MSHHILPAKDLAKDAVNGGSVALRKAGSVELASGSGARVAASSIDGRVADPSSPCSDGPCVGAAGLLAVSDELMCLMLDLLGDDRKG
jgi:hypothetical protein